MRRYPTQLVTMRAELLHATWRLSKSAGVPPLTCGSLLWPAPLLLAFRALDDEQAILELNRAS